MTLQHQVGTLDVEDGRIVNRMSGKKGFLGREQWHREEIIPIDRILAADTGRLGDLRLTLHIEGQPMGAAFLRCAPLAGLGELLQALKRQKPGISVSTSQSDLANELKQWVPDISVSDRFVEGVAAQAAQIEVKTYRDEDEYQKDAPRMVTQGWRMEAQTVHRGKVNLGRTVVKGGLFLPWAVMRPSRQGDPLTVTWFKEAKAAVDLTAPAPAVDEDVIGKLKKLAELRDDGVLTDEEFQTKKAELLARL